MEYTPRFWLSEKNCELCGVKLGLNSMKQKKLYCQICFHAICIKCTAPGLLFSPLVRKRACRRCAGREDCTIAGSAPPLECNPPPELNLSGESGTSEPADLPPENEESLIMDNVLSTARQLSASMSNYSPTAAKLVDSDLIVCSSQITARQEEVETLKAKEALISDEVQQRDEEIHRLSVEVGRLSQLNSELLAKIQTMEAKMANLTPSDGGKCCTLQ